ncbi:MAG TPA: class I adenylate-forming enzyme family protein [Polyangiales bacterium]|nr:class I adenylate-forming enzyme family protein [Polyangiales bacterium]
MDELSLLAAANEAPHRDCLVVNGTIWSYGDLADRVCAALSALIARGVAPGDRVALTPRVDLDSIVSLYALFELGCPAVLLHPRLSSREQSLVLEEAEPVHVIAEPLPRDLQTVAPQRSESIASDSTLAIVYTSGSKGRPRGARLSRRAFIASASAHAENLDWRPDDRWLLTMPLAHVGGLSIVTRSLIARRCVVLGPTAFDPREVAQIMETQDVTLLSVVPTMLRRLLQLAQPEWKPGTGLRAVLVGGAPFPDALRELATERKVPTLATYGCTEACSQISTQTPMQTGQPGSGRPVPGVDVRIESGEIQVRGDVLMDGYLGEDRSAEPWTRDGWLRTGDFGSFLPDGQLLVLGRIDDLIVTGGENVAPAEVEAWLETVPGIAMACVFSQPHEEWGEEVCAAIVIEGAEYSGDALRDRMTNELATHKRPRRIALLNALPLNRTGKVDRAAARSLSVSKLRPI